jgi:hypothetical protein
MEGEGRARPILNYFHREDRVGIAGWIASPYWSN